MPKLENWSITTNNDNPFLAPELRSIRIHGEVYQHENFTDGTKVTTSSVQELDLECNQAQTRNTLYTLGNPSEDYLKWLEQHGKSLEDYKQ